MDITSFDVIASNSFRNSAFVVMRLATVVLLSAVAVSRLAISLIVLVCFSAWDFVGVGAT